MHKAAATRSERIDIRTNREAKSIIERAAQLRHVSISAYLMDSALQKAKEDLRDTETFILDDTTGISFLRLFLRLRLRTTLSANFSPKDRGNDLIARPHLKIDPKTPLRLRLSDFKRLLPSKIRLYPIHRAPAEAFPSACDNRFRDREIGIPAKGASLRRPGSFRVRIRIEGHAAQLVGLLIDGRPGLGRLGLAARDLGEGIGAVGRGLGARPGGQLGEGLRGSATLPGPRRVLAQGKGTRA